MPGWFQNRFNKPIEERNYGSLYAMLSIVLLLTTLWAVANEISARRPWKDYQESYRKLKTRVLKMKVKEAKKTLDSKEIKKLAKRIAEISDKLDSEPLLSARNKADEIALKIRDVSQERADEKAKADSKNYFFEHLTKELQPSEARAARDERTAFEKKMVEIDSQLAGLERQKAVETAKFDPLVQEMKKLQNQRDSIEKSVSDLLTKIDETQAATIKVRQVMIADMDRGNFGNLKMRVDRCQSCHLGIDDPVMEDTNIFHSSKIFANDKAGEKWRKVFGPHPKPELLKKHDIAKVGCTGCHGGQPMSVDDVEHAHGQQEHWDRPLLTGAFMESNCRTCHEGTVQFGDQEWISTGKKLFIDFGCFGCHDGPGLPDWQKYKTGPSLLNVSHKLDAQWMYNWVMNPQRWNEHTRMPNFKFTPEQTEAVVAYIVDQSKGSSYKPAGSAPSGNAEHGKVVIKEVGCVACHVIDEYKGRGEFEYKETGKGIIWPNAAITGDRVAEGNMFGPDLNKVGSKVSADWLYDWVKNPRHYSSTARMPDMRLTDGEAADVVAYLMSKKDPNPETAPQLSHLTDPEWIKKGKAIVGEYGCFGCHLINGFETEGKVSVSLADFGKKTGNDLYFGYMSMPQLYSVRAHFDSAGYPLNNIHMEINNGEDWFTWTVLKLKNSRIYATDNIPQKMPVFNMSDREAYALAVMLRSQNKDYIPAGFSNQWGDQQKDVETGRFLTHWNNCQGCHKVEQQGGYVKDIIAKDMGLKGDDALPYSPPNLNTLGSKLQENWFYSFINNPGSIPQIRPWLKLRMPTFGFSPTDISKLSRYFLALDKQSLNFTDYSSYPATEESIAAGRELFAKLNCQKCHAAGSSPSNGGDAAVPVPNLGLAGNRLKPEWIERWIRNPAAIVPGTKMPGFWGTEEEPVVPDKTILGGDINKQIAAVRDYVWRIGGVKGGVPGGGSVIAPSGGGAPPPTAPKDSVATTAAKSDTAKKIANK